MKVKKIPFEETGYFSKSFLDFIHEKSELKEFFGLYPREENFRKQIDLKNFPLERRKNLVEVFESQYVGFDVSESTEKNIQLLKEKNTYTVTTGHQLNIFTGPLYFLYKIITTIKTCDILREKYPRFNFVPVYWMGSEDHDFEEISYFWLNNTKYQWKTDQSGAVGRFDPGSLKHLLDELPGDISPFKNAYLKHTNLSDAARYYVNELLGKYGLVILDADTPQLKSSFKNVIKEDIFNNISYNSTLETTKSIEQKGYSTQLHAREINFFYLKDGIRERIEYKGNSFHVIGTDISFSVEEMENEIENYPERFSPNVVLRPLYQEFTLPNLSYIGGPSELVYWFQLRKVFKSFNVAFPILQPRNFALIIPGYIRKKWDKTGFEMEDLFKETDQLIKDYTLKNSNNQLDLKERLKLFENEFGKIKSQAGSIDPTLEYSTEAAFVRLRNSIKNLEKKMLRAEKRNLSDKTRQITAVKEFLFPGGTLQERRDNFLNFYLEDREFLNKVYHCFDPLELQFHLLIDE